ncbi:hypothetical protein D3C72_513680 [compost metagenome]
MDRQVGDRATRLRTSDLHAPAVGDEALDHVGSEGKRGVGPQVFVVVRSLDAFDVVEAAHRNGVRAIRQTTQHPGHEQADVTGIVAVAERFPLDVFGTVKVVADVLDGGDFFHRALAKKGRADGANEGHVRSCRDFGNIAQQGNVLRAAVELEVGNGSGDRLTTRGVVLLGVGMHIQATLRDLRRILEILDQVILADIEQFDAHVLAEIGLIDQRFHTAPGGLHPLEIRVMHHGVQLAADLCIQRRNMFIQQCLVQTPDFARRLFDQIQKNTDSGSHSLIGRNVRQRLGTLKHFDFAQHFYRVEIDLSKQRAIYALAFFRQHCSAARLRVRMFDRHF